MKPIWLNVWEYRGKPPRPDTVEAVAHGSEAAAAEDIAEDLDEASDRSLRATLAVTPDGTVRQVDLEAVARDIIRENADERESQEIEGRMLRFRQAGAA